MEATLQRKLTTIVVADVAGSSRLMGLDEEGTHARLAGLGRELISPAIEAHGGTLVKKTGDGFLAEFPSVVEAIRCATEIQEGVARRNRELPPERWIVFRMGINTGDVIVADDDIHGEGVNVAARLEKLAEPGCIVVSRVVRDHVRDRLPVSFEDMGEQVVKNIARPVRAFRIVTGEETGRSPARERQRSRPKLAAAAAVAGLVLAGAAAWFTQSGRFDAPRVPPVELTARSTAPAQPAQRLSIIVLPFTNLSGDSRQDYLADGVTESLTTDLSRALPGSFVVARGTAFSYKGKSAEAAEVGRELKVRYVIAGSLVVDGDRLRVNARLVDAESNSELWAERFDKKLTGLFEVQDQIVGRVSRAAGLEVIDSEARRSEREHDPSAVDLVMRGQAIANRPASRETMIAARELFERALDHDPNNVDALAGVATTYVFEVLNSYYEEGREERLRDAEALIRRALKSDPRHLLALKVHAGRLRAEGEFEDAIEASKVVIAQNPGEPWAYKELGLNELYLGHLREALEWFEKADQIGPRDPSRWIWLGAMGRVQFFLGNPMEAIRLLKASADANPADPRAYALLAAVYAASEKGAEARIALASCLRLRPNMTISRLFTDWSVPLHATSPDYLSYHERLREGLRLAGMPEK